jgi:hypothetical protein
MTQLTSSRLVWMAAAGLLCSLFAWRASHAGESPHRLDGVWQTTDPRRLLEPEDGSPLPFRPAAAALYQKHLATREKGDTAFDLTSRCSSPGVPRILLLPYPFEIFERADQVIFAFGFNRLFRQVMLDKSQPDALYPMAMGFATGRWNGDTLTIVTRSRSSKTLLDDAIPNSDSLVVTERLRRKGDTIEDRMTIDDPKIFTRPWSATVHYKWLEGRQIGEDVCLDRVAAGHPPIEWPERK